jgi:hypothetical protein
MLELSRIGKRRGWLLLIPRGVLLPVEGGFEVYLRDQTHKDVDVSQAEPMDELSPRQRFSLAHEIAHTRFYKFSESVPSPDNTISNGRELEDVCDRAAACVLVPTGLLKNEIHEYGKEIDVEFVRSIASKFRTPLWVALERLSLVERSNIFERCIILARRHHSDAEIRALYYGVGLRPLLPRPTNYIRVTDWLPDFPRRVLDNRDERTATIVRAGRTISFTRTELGTSDDILLDVRAVA